MMFNFLVENAWSVFGLALSLLLLCLIPIIIEIWRTMRDVRVIVDRVEMITDIQGWFSFFNHFKNRDSRTRKKRRWD